MPAIMHRCLGIWLMFYGFSLFGAEEALLHAAMSGDLATVRSNIHFAAVAVDQDGGNALHWAIQNQHEEVARYLINRAPVLVNRVVGDGITPVYLAIELKLYDLALRCIDAGAEVNRFVNIEGYRAETPLHVAAIHGHVPTILALLGAGADIQSRYWVNNRVALHLAAGHGHGGAIRSLLAYGADTDIHDSRGHTPLRRACVGGHAHVVMLLIDAGAFIDTLPSELILCHGGGDNAPSYRCHDLIRFMAACWWVGAARYVVGLTALAVEIEEEGVVAVSDRETLTEFKRWCLEPAIQLLQEKVVVSDLEHELTEDLKKLVVAFVAAQEDLDAALRFARESGLGSMSDFLGSLGAKSDVGRNEEDDRCGCMCSIL